jgi:hypothetical protein
MVSALMATRLVSAQLALQVLQSDPPDSSSSDDSSSLLNSLNDLSSMPSQSQASLTSILNGLSSSSQTDTTATTSDGSSDDPDMTSSDFMSLLKNNLETDASDGGSAQAKAMLAALTNGTLTISDPTSGQSIAGWDPDSTDNQSTTSKDATTIDTSDWNDFLNAHLTRGTDGAFTKSSDGSYIDKTSGNEAYFGQVGSQFYYITWPSASSASSSASSGTASTSSSQGTTQTGSTGSGV